MASVRPSPARPWQLFVSDPEHGPLPAFLVILTAVTGVVDAVSILSLGRVFVANMTGNVVFIGFALARASGFSLSASLSALGGFLVGAFTGGAVIERTGTNRAALLRNNVLIELVLLVTAAAVAEAVGSPFRNGIADAIAALAAAAMGIQNAVARRLSVPDLMTTVLTMTLTGIAVDFRAGNTTALARRFVSVATMLGGAVGGASLVLYVRPAAGLDVAAGLTATVAAFSIVAARSPADWHQ